MVMTNGVITNMAVEVEVEVEVVTIQIIFHGQTSLKPTVQQTITCNQATRGVKVTPEIPIGDTLRMMIILTMNKTLINSNQVHPQVTQTILIREMTLGSSLTKIKITTIKILTMAIKTITITMACHKIQMKMI